MKSHNAPDIVVSTLGPLKGGGTFCMVPVEPPTGEMAAEACLSLARSLSKNLAARVIAIEATAPSVAFPNSNGRTTKPGLLEFLDSPSKPVADFVVRNKDCHDVLYRGSIEARADITMPASGKLDTALKRLKEEYDYVLAQLPPAHLNPMLTESATIFDGTILVLTCGSTHWEVAQDIKTKLTKAGANVVGVVMNKRQFYIPRWLYKRL